MPPPPDDDAPRDVSGWLYLLHKTVQEGQAAQLALLKYILLGIGALLAVNGIPLVGL